MFQFSQVTEILSGFLGGDNEGGNNALQEILKQLSEAGIDPSALEGLGADQVMELINNAGIDLSEFNPDQLTEALQQLNIGDVDVGGMVEKIGVDNLAETIFKR